MCSVRVIRGDGITVIDGVPAASLPCRNNVPGQVFVIHLEAVVAHCYNDLGVAYAYALPDMLDVDIGSLDHGVDEVPLIFQQRVVEGTADWTADRFGILYSRDSREFGCRLSRLYLPVVTDFVPTVQALPAGSFLIDSGIRKHSLDSEDSIVGEVAVRGFGKRLVGIGLLLVDVCLLEDLGKRLAGLQHRRSSFVELYAHSPCHQPGWPRGRLCGDNIRLLQFTRAPHHH